LSDKGLDVAFSQLDVSDEGHINRMADQVESQFGRLDVLVNNAAILYHTWQKAVNADFESEFTLNLSRHLRDQFVLIVDIVTTVEISVAFTVASTYSKITCKT
jgi:NAD(P)-dependent dehydrogenase (short-subunit alcohol dehydrogenase family)